ncbi:beta-glucan synthesis-associated protein-domain-containing protein [Suillus fuscotomentosus]|uniref:Beta-glucan synthesis-associated protein-domain-containing protein n=1 Tax=Suillus fuscotomentosus TaxID=1912939 RepID=A0AAD4DN52_9AGAM|nr:beta-glucan synthesis-associated protein-domain-containing protein [Suillus fuscotomentosus]KAG1884845.1 beta-glucan synthesis-associated protein-domain-containing protein [Suillus fuscotomentosus]
MRIWQSFPRSFRLGFLACNNLSAGNILLNGTGQISFLFQMAQLIDPDMPGSAAARSGFDGLPYELVFSDDFNTANRTFWPGDDPFWEAANIKYGSTGDQERYGPAQITTSNKIAKIKQNKDKSIRDPDLGLRDRNQATTQQLNKKNDTIAKIKQKSSKMKSNTNNILTSTNASTKTSATPAMTRIKQRYNKIPT